MKRRFSETLRAEFVQTGQEYEPGVPFWGPRQTVQTQNAASDQGLHCLLTGISIQKSIKMKKYTRHP